MNTSAAPNRGTGWLRRAVLTLVVVLVLGLLSANLAVLLMILERMPPTAGELRATTDPDARRELLARVPLTRADIMGTVDVEVVNSF